MMHLSAGPLGERSDTNTATHGRPHYPLELQMYSHIFSPDVKRILGFVALQSHTICYDSLRGERHLPLLMHYFLS